MELLVKGARIVDFSSDFIGDVYIKNGLIADVGKDLIKDCDRIIGEGLMLLPSFIDMHAHFRDPGLTCKEDLTSGSMAAVRGGYTAVNLMANTKPVCSSMDIVNYVQSNVKKIGLIDAFQVVSVTRDMEGKDLSHIEELDRGVRYLSEDGKGIEDNEIMLLAMKKAKEKNLGIISHAEYRNVGRYDTRLSENLMTLRDIELAKYTGCHLHMAHISTREAMEYIINAKSTHANITCEVTPHHFCLFDNDYRVNPPIRSKEDVDYLIKAIELGYVDAIGTDHAPHTLEDKLKGAPGLSGIETAFSLCYTKLVLENGLSLNRLSEVLSKGPGELLGLNKGQIKPGFDGDLVLVNVNEKIAVDSKDFESKGKNTPFQGMEFMGSIEKTIKGGKIVYSRNPNFKGVEVEKYDYR